MFNLFLRGLVGVFFIREVEMLKSKTIWFAALIAAFGALQLGLQDMQEFISPVAHAWINLVTGIGIAALRAVTVLPLSEK